MVDRHRVLYNDIRCYQGTYSNTNKTDRNSRQIYGVRMRNTILSLNRKRGKCGEGNLREREREIGREAVA